MKILLCFGTRPEAIKMAPIYHQLKKQPNFQVEVCVTAQHREMLDQVLHFFQLITDYDLDLMKAGQTLNQLSASILTAMDTVLQTAQPDLVLVHGDTTTSSMVALAAFHLGIKVGHVEAGLRSFNKLAPFPEEINRQFTGKLADIHFTPTAVTTQNLLDEGVQPQSIIQTGNTVIDALLWTCDKIKEEKYVHPEIELLKNSFPKDKKIILVTGHRRENYGLGFENLCEALISISKRDDVSIVYPVHLNPNVQDVVREKLTNQKNIYLIPPSSYPAFVWLMQESFLILTDSGGIQEEAPTLGKPVLVTRNVSERNEGVKAGFSLVIGTEQKNIEENVIKLLDDFEGFTGTKNPYGDGDAAIKIVEYLSDNFSQ